MSSDIEVLALSRRPGDTDRFLRVPYEVYRDDPHWVAPLLMDLKKVFTPANPLFEHATMQLWLALRGGRAVGRIAGIVDDHHNRTQRDAAAFFGFFESVNDAEVSRRLFATVHDWARQRGMRRVLGPMNPTTNDECGLLIEGFDGPPVFMMTYNPRYYVDLVAGEGFRKAKDLIAFHIDVAQCPLERLGRIAEKVRARHPELRFKAVRRKTLESDLTKIKEVYNAAWEDNWGFVPMTDSEVNFLASRLKPLLLEGLIWIADTATEPVAFMLAIPDYNIPLQPLRGHLLTARVLGFIPYALGWKYPPRCRVITLGVKGKYRNRGLEAVMLTEGFRTGRKVGFTEAEASWILEDNTAMCRLLETFGGRPYRTYRLYEREL
jgi:hypothetical protein